MHSPKRFCSHMEQFRCWSKSTTFAEGTWRTEQNLIFYSEHIFLLCSLLLADSRPLGAKEKVLSQVRQCPRYTLRLKKNHCTVIMAQQLFLLCSCRSTTCVTWGSQVTRCFAKRCYEKLFSHLNTNEQSQLFTGKVLNEGAIFPLESNVRNIFALIRLYFFQSNDNTQYHSMTLLNLEWSTQSDFLLFLCTIKTAHLTSR